MPAAAASPRERAARHAADPRPGAGPKLALYVHGPLGAAAGPFGQLPLKDRMLKQVAQREKGRSGKLRRLFSSASDAGGFVARAARALSKTFDVRQSAEASATARRGSLPTGTSLRWRWHA